MYRDATLKITDGEKVLLSKKKPKFAPGEMEMVKISAEKLRDAESIKLSLEF